MPADDELRARLDAAQAEYEAAHAKYEAWVVPPMEPDATPEDYQSYNQVRLADHQTWMRAQEAWFELDARQNPHSYPEGAWPREPAPDAEAEAAGEAEPEAFP